MCSIFSSSVVGSVESPPGPVVAADAAAAVGSVCSPLDGAGYSPLPGRPFCARPASVGRGVTDRLSLSLEARGLSDDTGGPAEDEVVDTAVSLPALVARPIKVSRLSVLGETSMSEPLSDSDMVGLLVALTVKIVCLPWPQQPCV